MAGGGENASDTFGVAERVVPDDFADAIVEGTDGGIGPDIVIAAAPAFGFALDSFVEDAKDSAGVKVEEAGLRVEARSHPVGGTVGARLDERAVGSGGGFRFGNGAAFRVNAGGPSLVDKGSGDEMLTGRAIEEKEEPVAAGLGKQVTRFALEVSVEEDRSFDGVPIVDV